ncbi:porin [Amphritea balenae]|nr:porin [Amphritea balenae]
MKKSIIALAVAGALTAPMVAQADAVLSGAVAVDYINKELANNDKGFFQIDDAIIDLSASSEAEGLTSGAQIQYEVGSGATSLTYANAYLSGDFGTAIAGKIANPINDVTGDSLGTSDSEEAGAGSGADLVSDEIIAAAYMTPDMGGFSAYAGVIANADGAADENTADAWLAGVKFAMAGVKAHLGYANEKGTGGDDDSTVIGLKLGYAIDALSLTGVYTKYEDDGDKFDTTLGLAAGYDLGATDLYAFHVQDDFEGAEKAKTTGVKASYALATGASAYAEWSKTTNRNGVDGDDGKTITLGYKVSF